MPTDAEFSTLESVVEVLKPLSYLTDALSGEKQATASAIMPVMKHVETKLSPAASDNQLMTDMKKAIWNNLEARYADPEVSDILHVASYLDPRFKDDTCKAKLQKSLQNARQTMDLFMKTPLTLLQRQRGCL